MSIYSILKLQYFDAIACYFFIVKENKIGNVNGNKFSRNVNGIKPKKIEKKK